MPATVSLATLLTHLPCRAAKRSPALLLHRCHVADQRVFPRPASWHGAASKLTASEKQLSGCSLEVYLAALQLPRVGAQACVPCTLRPSSLGCGDKGCTEELEGGLWETHYTPLLSLCQYLAQNIKSLPAKWCTKTCVHSCTAHTLGSVPCRCSSWRAQSGGI